MWAPFSISRVSVVLPFYGSAVFYCASFLLLLLFSAIFPASPLLFHFIPGNSRRTPLEFPQNGKGRKAVTENRHSRQKKVPKTGQKRRITLGFVVELSVKSKTLLNKNGGNSS